MKALLKRIAVLEQRTPDPELPRKTLVPEWLLDARRARGLPFDPADDNSIRRAVASVANGTQPVG